MESGSVLMGLATVAIGIGVPAVGYAALFGAEAKALRGIHKVLWCDGVQRVVDVDFMQVNPNTYDVASCTAFSVDQCFSCDKRCMKVLRRSAA